MFVNVSPTDSNLDETQVRPPVLPVSFYGGDIWLSTKLQSLPMSCLSGVVQSLWLLPQL
jgi:hypothetical protein